MARWMTVAGTRGRGRRSAWEHAGINGVGATKMDDRHASRRGRLADMRSSSRTNCAYRVVPCGPFSYLIPHLVESSLLIRHVGFYSVASTKPT